MNPYRSSRTDLRLQMGVLPPSYDDVPTLGKAPPAYRESAEQDDESLHSQPVSQIFGFAISLK